MFQGVRNLAKQEIMQTGIDKYRIVSKIFEGAALRLVFQKHYDTANRKILELKELVGFIENIEPRQTN
jgi:hypothetical protein